MQFAFPVSVDERRAALAPKLIGITALSLYFLLPGTARATTYYVDAVAGSDGNAGTSRVAAWRTLAQVWNKITDATIGGDDLVLMRPGRYYVLDGTSSDSTERLPGVLNQVRGGTAGHPITISVDTNYGGNVEITGSLPGNWNKAAGKTYDRTSAWTTVASECTGNGAPWACCTGSGAGCAGIYYTAAPPPNGSTGTGPGTCFQPGANPGDAPTMWKILYSADSAPITMPSFEAGKNQCWFRPEYAQFCTAASEPYACCTAAGVGASCIGTVRVYAKTASGAAPDAISPPLEFPVAVAEGNFGRSGTIQYLTITNNGNGRIFYWRWGIANGLQITRLNYAVFEDFEIGYQSMSRAFCGSGSGATCAASGYSAGMRSGSGFPRNTGGFAYLVREVEALGVAPPLHHHNTLRRGVIRRGQGDEAYHQCATTNTLVVGTNPASCTTVADCTQTSLGTAVLCSSSTCYYHDTSGEGYETFEDVEFAEIPWEVTNGDTATYGDAYSWPPPGYGAWSSVYASSFSPLGGGGQTAGAWIMQAQNNVYRRLYVHDIDGIASFETNCEANNCSGGGKVYTQPANNLVEDSTFDGSQVLWAGSSAGPFCRTCTCKTVANCFGPSGGTFLKQSIGGWDIDVPGHIWRNNVIRNCRGTCFYVITRTGRAGRVVGPQFVNNTVHILGIDDLDRFPIGPLWGTVSSPAIFKNNIIVQDNLGMRYTIWVDPDDASTVAIDRNLYGPSNVRWRWGSANGTTTFSTWQSQSGQDAGSPVPANPLFVNSPLDLHITFGSPAMDNGITLPGFSTDHDGVTRPQGPAWDIGAYEIRIPGPPTLISVLPVP
jgi:hypothetical protein